MENLAEFTQNGSESDTEILRAEIIRHANHWHNHGCFLYNLPPTELEIRFYENSVTAGRACASGNFVEFNLQLAEENEEDFFLQTIPHEIAHIIADRKLDSKGHDNAWKSVMVKFGLNPDRCHSYDVSAYSHRNFQWKCVNCGQEYKVGKNLHGKMLRNLRRCGVCKSPVKFVGKIMQYAEAF